MKVFWIRFVLWVLIGLVAPILYIFLQTNLFYTVNKISIWLVIIILIVFLFLKQLWKYLKKGVQYSLTMQIIGGLVKVILPLLAVFAVVLIIRLKSDEVLKALKGIENFLYVLIPCELVAIPLNPMPKWANDNRDNQLAQFFERIRGGE